MWVGYRYRTNVWGRLLDRTSFETYVGLADNFSPTFSTLFYELFSQKKLSHYRSLPFFPAPKVGSSVFTAKRSNWKACSNVIEICESFGELTLGRWCVSDSRRSCGRSAAITHSRLVDWFGAVQSRCVGDLCGFSWWLRVNPTRAKSYGQSKLKQFGTDSFVSFVDFGRSRSNRTWKQSSDSRSNTHDLAGPTMIAPGKAAVKTKNSADCVYQIEGRQSRACRSCSPTQSRCFVFSCLCFELHFCFFHWSVCVSVCVCVFGPAKCETNVIRSAIEIMISRKEFEWKTKTVRSSTRHDWAEKKGNEFKAPGIMENVEKIGKRQR